VATSSRPEAAQDEKLF